jgi:hypothetical protein
MATEGQKKGRKKGTNREEELLKVTVAGKKGSKENFS